MELLENISLRAFNTFGVDVTARQFGVLSTGADLEFLLKEIRTGIPFLILGEGSNVLFTEDFDGLVVRNELYGIDVLDEDKEHVLLRAGAGENWSDLVDFTVSRNWGGIENLSLIPGTPPP